MFRMIFKMTNEEKRHIVLEGHLMKGLLILSLPLMFNNLMKTLYNFVDRIWVAQITPGVDLEQTAVGIVFPVLMFFVAFGFGIQIAATSLMSQHIGANKKEKADKLASQLMLFTFLLGIVMMVVGLVCSPFILHLMGLDKDAYPLSSIYLKIMFLTIPFDFMLMLFTGMRQAYGDTVTPVIFTAISVVLNLVLDPLFILVFHWGVVGAAVATVLSKMLVVPFWMHKAFFDRDAIHVIVSKMKLRIDTIVNVLLIMLPASLGQALNSIGFVVLNYYIYSYGDYTMAAFISGNSITNLVMMPAMGIGAALAFYIGQNIGNNNFERAKKSFHASLKMTLIIMIIGALILIPIRGYVIKLFLQEPKSLKLAMVYMVFVAANLPLMGLFQNFNGVFQGSGKTLYTFILAITRLWGIRIPTIIIFKNLTNFGSTGIWVAMLMSNVVICILGTILYKLGNWQQKIV